MSDTLQPVARVATRKLLHYAKRLSDVAEAHPQKFTMAEVDKLEELAATVERLGDYITLRK